MESGLQRAQQALSALGAEELEQLKKSFPFLGAAMEGGGGAGAAAPSSAK